jgi:hypothetical protein
MMQGEVANAIAQLADLELGSRLLCHVALELERDAPLVVGQTPWQWLRVSNIGGGRFQGERLRGELLNSGADWAFQGQDANGTPVSQLDVRSLWRTDDGALIHVTYHGRVVIPQAKWDQYRDLGRVADMSPAEYYFRTLPLFQTADARYTWLNNIVSVGMGKRTQTGVLYKIFEIL